MTRYLHASLGPVQDFVVHSRRTRDLWSSSYLLSVLAGHGIHGGCTAGGSLVRPTLHGDPLLSLISGEGRGDPPTVGSIPNRFTLQVPDDDVQEVAAAVREGIDRAWGRVAEAVWSEFVEPVASDGLDVRAIWDRQVDRYWDLTWVVSDAAADGAMARRKRWRSRSMSAEPGDMCTVMHDLQELSGCTRACNRQEREKQDAFWEALRRRTKSLDIRPGERLSAIALIKRLFPRVAVAALGWEPDTTRWPSTSFLAASDWLRDAVEHARTRSEEYATTVETHARSHASTVMPGAFSGLPADARISRIDADYLYDWMLEDERRVTFAGDDRSAAVADLRRGMRRLADELSSAGRPGRPSPFYGMILADGDRLGKQVKALGVDRIGDALARFTSQVSELVTRHHGVVVYAGGDDVLAMLPLSGCLACARDLADAYRDAFGFDASDDPPTLSASVVLAHLRMPLGVVLAECHRLLDQEAKEGNGRDSLSVGLLKRGGMNALWTSRWSRQSAEGEPGSAVERLLALSEALGRAPGDVGLSASLIYRIRDTMSLMCDWPRWRPGSAGAIPEDLDLPTFLRADVARSLEASGVDLSQAESSTHVDELVRHLVRVLHPCRGDEGGRCDPLRVTVDALFIARFLAGGGASEEEA